MISAVHGSLFKNNTVALPRLEYTFTSGLQSVVIPAGYSRWEVLLVAGGGSGGASGGNGDIGGGGSGGEVRKYALVNPPAGTYYVFQVGVGGNGGSAGSNTVVMGLAGTPIPTLTAYGGGYGASYADGRYADNGGGGSAGDGVDFDYSMGASNNMTGYMGGNGDIDNPPYAGGAGAGALGDGQTATSIYNGSPDGNWNGDWIDFFENGDMIEYGKGGGSYAGGTYVGDPNRNERYGVDGVNGTGSGGSGAFSRNGIYLPGGSGGSGVVKMIFIP